MALVEIELRLDLVTNLVWLLLSKSPIPIPWLSLLGSNRLLSKSFQWHVDQDFVFNEMPVGVVAPTGTLPFRTKVTISHLSIDELAINANAPGEETPCTAWLLFTADPLTGNAIALRTQLLQLKTVGGTVQVFPTPLIVGEQILPLEGVDDIRAGAILMSGDIVTIRFAVGANDNLTLPPGNLLLENMNDNWLFHISGEVFADRVRRQLETTAESLSQDSKDTSIEDAPEAAWLPLPDDDSGFVRGTVGVKKINACANVNLSVQIVVILTLIPDIPTERVDLGLRVSSDASDWDVFRCWLGTGAIGSILAGILGGFISGIISAIASLVMIGEFVRVEAGAGVKGAGVGGSFNKVSSDATSAYYTSSINLPRLPNGTITYAKTRPEGLIVRGTLSVLPAVHQVIFEPDGGILSGMWRGSYSCKERKWITSYDVQAMDVSDEATVLGETIENPGVTVFSTSTFREPGASRFRSPARHQWVMDAPSRVTSIPVIKVRRLSPPSAGEKMQFYLHTSAGIRRFDIGPIPVLPASLASPTPDVLAIYNINCRQFTRNWDRIEQLRWLVDPPPSDYGIRPLRQWMLTFQGLPQNASILLRSTNNSEDTTRQHNYIGESSGVIEILTSQEEDIIVEHDLKESEAEVRLVQRWILPKRVVPLEIRGESISLIRNWPGLEPTITIKSKDRILAFKHGEFLKWEGGGIDHMIGPYNGQVSVSLPNGQVAALWRGSMIIGIPWGGPT